MIDNAETNSISPQSTTLCSLECEEGISNGRKSHSPSGNESCTEICLAALSEFDLHKRVVE